MKSWMYLALMPVVVAFNIGAGFWMAKLGFPQQSWLFCHLLKWCE
jgi:hypothetical protein